MTKEQFHIAIRVSTDPRYGYGHIARQIALRKHFGVRVIWFTDPGGKQTLPDYIADWDDIKEETDKNICDKLFQWGNINTNSVLICDSYHLAPSLFKKCANKVFFFCDHEQERVSKNITLVNTQPTAHPSKRHLFGPAYFAIDTKEKAQQTLDFAGLHMPVNCLISFGSVDSGNLTGKTLTAIINHSELRSLLRPICVLGTHFEFKESIKEQLHAFPSAEILDGVDSLLNLPISCSVAVGAPGLSHAERLYMGIATVLIPQNPNHAELCKAWEKLGCGLQASSKLEDISRCLIHLSENKFLIAQSLSTNGQKIINGKGAAKIANFILKDNVYV